MPDGYNKILRRTDDGGLILDVAISRNIPAVRIINFFYVLYSNIRYELKHSLVFNLFFMYDLKNLFRKKMWRL